MCQWFLSVKLEVGFVLGGNHSPLKTSLPALLADSDKEMILLPIFSIPESVSVVI